MTSTARRPPVDVGNHRPLTRNKQINNVLLKSEARRMPVNIAQLSPEAQKAMIMTQEDAKENVLFNARNVTTDNKATQESNKNNINTSKVGHSDIKTFGSVKDSKPNSRAASLKSMGTRITDSPRSRKITASSFGASIQTATARSRSTLSLTDRNLSISDNTESCYNYSNGNITKTTVCPTKITQSKDNGGENVRTINPAKAEENEKQLQNCTNGNSDECINEHCDATDNNERTKENEQAAHPKSFVLALDRVLEERFISRLKGDITNTTIISEPGKVRALDGGRLTNAQEVVVNVCHDDDRELIFHDDDEENLKNAKAISEIRINLWMAYNEGFQPDDVADDISICTVKDSNVKVSLTNEPAQEEENRNSAQVPTERTANKLFSDRSRTTSRCNNKSKWQAVKKDVNNNSTNAKLKLGVSNTARDTSSRRLGSIETHDGSRRSGVSSLKKDKRN